jgi:hypothetical protein
MSAHVSVTVTQRLTVEVGDVWHDRTAIGPVCAHGKHGPARKRLPRRYPHSIIIIEHGAGGRYVVHYPRIDRRATLSERTITELYVRDTIGDPQR